jgi:GNAT superfamily N-acetyltransferase
MSEIVRAGAEALEELRPLWLALRDHHADVMPHLGPPREADDSWRVRKRDYSRWLAEPGAFLLIARAQGRAVGYALVRANDEVSATWPRGGHTALLESLSVARAARGSGIGAALARGSGIGAALVQRVREECAKEGFAALTVGTVFGNRDAIRFYEREGFQQEAILLRDTRYRP